MTEIDSTTNTARDRLPHLVAAGGGGSLSLASVAGLRGVCRKWEESPG
jgi:hypothetical protein